ncbi:MAG TPA: hypothetical protein VFF53_08610 [Geobacteraceae bacterium]|nr:hypothetical protein [Geobacteraceae bacterium]
MRNLLTVACALLTAALLMGMGNIGGTPEGTVPKTEENIRAQLIDRSGVSNELTRFSMDGNVFLKGRRGEGQMSVFFRDLKEVSFGPVSGNDAPADLLLTSGKHVQLKVHTRDIFYGDTGSGTYHISAGDVSRIVFHK